MARGRSGEAGRLASRRQARPPPGPVGRPEVRADLIRQFYEREDARNLADVLMDPTEVIGLLEELENLSP